MGMSHESRDTVTPPQLITAPLAKGHVLPIAGNLQPTDKSGFASWEEFSFFEPLKTSFRNVGASSQSKVEKQSSKSQSGKASGAEWDELGRLELHPALQIPEGDLKAEPGRCSRGQ